MSNIAADLAFDLGGELGIGPTLPAEVAADFFGVDLLFDDDLQATSSGDYSEISGLTALRQSIRSRLLTSPGEYIAQPTFGCGLRTFVKKRSSQSERDALRQTVIEQISQDDRVQSIEDVTIEQITEGPLPGVRISLRILALGRENSYQLTTYAD